MSGVKNGMTNRIFQGGPFKKSLERAHNVRLGGGRKWEAVQGEGPLNSVGNLSIREADVKELKHRQEPEETRTTL